MTNAGHVAEALKRHYIRRADVPTGMFLTEVGSPDGRRKADALWLPAKVSGSVGTGIVGHEIKVARSDVLAELADPTKADAWARYCTRWWLVVSEAKLVEGLDIPDDWGVMAMPAGRLRAFKVLKPAPPLTPHDLTPAVGRLATVIAYRELRARESVAAEKRMADVYRGQVEKFQSSVEARAAANVSPVHRRVHEIILELGKLRSDSDFWFMASDDDAATIARRLFDMDVAEEIAKAVRRSAAEKLREVDRALLALSTNYQIKGIQKLLGDDDGRNDQI